MSKNNIQENLKRTTQRRLSEFMARELLYEYMNDTLDYERKVALENLLAESESLRINLENMRLAQQYCEKLRDIELSQPQLVLTKKSLSGFSAFSHLLKVMRSSQLVRWTAEAFVASSVLAALIFFLWPIVFNKTINSDSGQSTIFELNLTDKSALPEGDAIYENDQGMLDTPPVSESDELGQEQKALALENELKPIMESVTDDSQTEALNAKGQETQKPSDQTDQSTSKNEVDREAEQTTAQTTEEPKPKNMRGTLYRIFMELEDLDKITTEISNEILALEGKKAGEVPLGWRKPKGSYYHFTLPEEKYEQLVTNLKRYGGVRIYQDPHPRVMPEGVLRLILWIEDVSQ